MDEVEPPNPDDLVKQISVGPAPPFALALSGGGSRASLYCLGGLLALVDRGINRRVTQIASVSGGSIVSAFVAQRCDYASSSPAEMDELATEFVKRTKRGVLPTRVLIGIVAAIAAASIAAAFMGARIAGSATAVLAAMLVAGTLLLFAGKLVEFKFGRLYFGDSGACLIADCRRTVEHVICTTDLVSGQAAYISTQNGERIWLRDGRQPNGTMLYPPKLTLKAAVRASAGFPGIPPRRYRVRRFHADGPHKQTLLLCDGGLWNNLGSQVLREDFFFDGVPHPQPAPIAVLGSSLHLLHGVAEEHLTQPLLCLNASAALRPVKSRLFHVPVIASVLGLTRGMTVLVNNTVTPRSSAMTRDLSRQAGHSYAAERLDAVADIATPLRDALAPSQVVVSIGLIASTLKTRRDEQTARIMSELRARPTSENMALSDARITGPLPSAATKTGPTEGQSSESAAREEVADRQIESLLPDGFASWLDTLVTDTFASMRVVEEDGWLGLTGRPSILQSDYAEFPTTLGRVDSVTAFDLLLAGYASALSWSYVVAPLGGNSGGSEPELPSPLVIHERLARIAGLPAWVRREPVENLLKACMRDPANAHLMTALLLHARRDDARSVLEGLVAYSPKGLSPVVRLQLAQIRLENGELDGAAACLDFDVSGLEPDEASGVRLLLAKTKAEAGERADADRWFAEVVSGGVEPYAAKARLALGVQAFNDRDLDRCIDLLKPALEYLSEVDEATGAWMLGFSYFQSDADKSTYWLERARQLNTQPFMSQAELFLGVHALAEGDRELAAQLLEAAREHLEPSLRVHAEDLLRGLNLDIDTGRNMAGASSASSDRLFEIVETTARAWTSEVERRVEPPSCAP